MLVVVDHLTHFFSVNLVLINPPTNKRISNDDIDDVDDDDLVDEDDEDDDDGIRKAPESDAR